jgi:hypothetical protein
MLVDDFAASFDEFHALGRRERVELLESFVFDCAFKLFKKSVTDGLFSRKATHTHTHTHTHTAVGTGIVF